MNKIIGIMKVRDEEDILPKMLESSKWLDGLVVLDNGSTDNTKQILQECPLVLDYVYDDNPFHEMHMSQILLQIASKYNPEWFAEVDADEIFDNDIYKIKDMDLSEYNTINYDIHYMLDNKCYSISKNWSRIYKNLGAEFFTDFDKNRPLHWLKNPIPKENREIYYSGVVVYHYSIRSYEQGMRKYKRYTEVLDPNLEYQPKGYERLRLMAEGLKTKNYNEFGSLI